MISPPLDYAKLREIAERAARPVETAGAAIQRDRDLVFLSSTFTAEVCLALLADNARMRGALRRLCDVVGNPNGVVAEDVRPSWDQAMQALSGADDGK